MGTLVSIEVIAQHGESAVDCLGIDRHVGQICLLGGGGPSTVNLRGATR